MALHAQQVEVNGRKFSVSVDEDNFHPKPWENCDMLDNSFDGRYHRRDKYPREMIVHSDRFGSKIFYDFANAVAHGKKSGLTGEQADQEAKKEYDWIRRWYNDQWAYVSVDAVDVLTGETVASLGGCEYDFSDKSLKPVLDDYIIPDCEEYVSNVIRNFRPDFYFMETA